MKNNNSKKILFMGPLTNRKNPEMTSGTIILFEDLIRQLKKNHIDYTIIDTNKRNYSNFLSAYLSIFFQLLTAQKESYHISLHSTKDYMVLSVIIIFVGRFFKKKTSLRLFGGANKDVYIRSKGILKKILTFIFKSTNALFFETKYQIDFFSDLNKKSFWFPNSRTRTLQPKLPRTFQKKFVFMSHIIQEKGVDELIEVVQQLDSDYIVDFYGLIRHKKYTQEYFLKNNVSYKGALTEMEVLKRLNEYDVMVLPSYREGYPGIVIEAYSLGMPVVTTTLPAIQEIVDPYETGLLVKPGSIKELINAIKYFNKENYGAMSEYAYKKFDDFQSDKQTKQFLERVKNA